MPLLPAVFLDRDGVINRSVVREGVPHPPDNLGEVEILPGVREAMDLLAAAGFLRIVVTNQPDVARGTQTVEGVEAINRFLADNLPISAFYVCYHDGGDGCDCRKPRPGMLLRAAREHGIDLAASFMVGDRWSDVEAGRAAGCRAFLIDMPYSQHDRCMPESRVADLLDAARRILLVSR
jgi:D-glycero-D-manno-heptose 1,7-bisphosphate phosphatase